MTQASPPDLFPRMVGSNDDNEPNYADMAFRTLLGQFVETRKLLREAELSGADELLIHRLRRASELAGDEIRQLIREVRTKKATAPKASRSAYDPMRDRSDA